MRNNSKTKFFNQLDDVTYKQGKYNKMKHKSSLRSLKEKLHEIQLRKKLTAPGQ